MKETAVKYFLEGYSCSEAIVKSAADKGYISQDALAIATSFSGGMGVRCLCGAVAGSQMIIGAMFGKTNENSGKKAREFAKHFNEEFSKKYKVNCCKVLSSGYDFASPERKNHCAKIVANCAEIVENIVNTNIVAEKNS